jgi:dihydroanticapsin dehydrogenase
MSLNARSCFLTCKHSAPYLVERGGVTITNMASLAALNGAAGLGGYSASKAAIVALTRVMAAELGRFQIRVNAVCPGWIDTAFNEPAITALGGASARDEMIAGSVPLGRQGSVREVADVFVFLASQASSYVTGQAIVVDGGLY